MANRQLTTGGMIVAGTGVAFLVDSLIPWHRTCFELLGNSTCVSENAWGTPFSLLASLLVLALVAEVIAVQLMDQKLPAVGTLTWAQIRLGAAGAVLALVVLQLLVGDNGLGRSFGLFIGLVLAAGLLYGTFARNKESEPAAAKPDI
jgi:hypothetical protein